MCIRDSGWGVRSDRHRLRPDHQVPDPVSYTHLDVYKRQVSSASSEQDLFHALEKVTRRMGFDHFALAYHQRPTGDETHAMLVHDYPDVWAKIYVSFDLGGTDPVRRACEKTLTGFEWEHLERLIPLTRGDRQMLGVGREDVYKRQTSAAPNRSSA